MSLLIVFPLVSLMFPVEFKAILYGGSVKMRSIELFGSRDRRLRASSLNICRKHVSSFFVFYGILLYSMNVL